MISICPLTFDLEGGVILHPRKDLSNLRTARRRVSRRRLLDGTVSLYDGGFVEGDRDLVIQAWVDRSTHERFETIAKTYALVTVSAEDGCFRAAVSSWNYRAPRLSVTLMLKEKISEE